MKGSKVWWLITLFILLIIFGIVVFAHIFVKQPPYYSTPSFDVGYYINENNQNLNCTENYTTATITYYNENNTVIGNCLDTPGCGKNVTCSIPKLEIIENSSEMCPGNTKEKYTCFLPSY